MALKDTLKLTAWIWEINMTNAKKVCTLHTLTQITYTVGPRFNHYLIKGSCVFLPHPVPI